MNLDFWLRRLTGRATCRLGAGSRLLPPARIRNIRGANRYIEVGSNSLIAGELLVFAHGGQISIGDWCFVGEGSRIWSAGSVSIGNRVMISHNVNLFDSLTHPLQAAARHAHFRAIFESGHPREIDLGERDVSVGDDAWIGASACILRGVTIGEGAIVGAGAVVTRDVPAGVVVAGNPAEQIKELSDAER